MQRIEETATAKRRRRIFLWIAAFVVLGGAGTAFAYKIAEFIYTLGDDDARGFADVPVTVYFIVAAGWVCLLVWCWLTGQFHDVEKTKYEMIEQEERYEREGQ